MGNVHKSNVQWQEFAVDNGYKNMKDMLEKLYVQGGHSIRELGQFLGVGKDRAAQLLERYGIPRRSRGGVR